MAASTERGERVAGRIIESIDELCLEHGYDPNNWRQDQWDAVTRDVLFALSDKLDGDDVKDLVAYATEDCDGWEIIEIGIPSLLGGAIWNLWQEEAHPW